MSTEIRPSKGKKTKVEQKKNTKTSGKRGNATTKKGNIFGNPRKFKG